MPRIDVDVLGVPAFSVAVCEDGVLRYDGMNDANTAVTGLTKQMVIGQTPHDYMPKDIADRLLAQYLRCIASGKVEEHEEELHLPLGYTWWRTTLAPVIDETGKVVQILGLCVNTTEQRRLEQDLKSAALTDPLTGIPNRRCFERDLENAVARATDTGKSFSLILADVDRFKAINDAHGHAVGDVVLQTVAGRLQASVRETDKVARIGGDEFVAIISAATEGAVIVALDRISNRLAGKIPCGERELDVGVSLGTSLWRPGMMIKDLMSEADASMYRQKAERAEPTTWQAQGISDAAGLSMSVAGVVSTSSEPQRNRRFERYLPTL